MINPLRQFESPRVQSTQFDVAQFVHEHDAAGERLTVVHRYGKREGLVTRFSTYGSSGDWRNRRIELRNGYRATPGAKEQLVRHLERLGRIVDWTR